MKRSKFAAELKSQRGCPVCGLDQLCPCKSCNETNAGKTTWIWTEDGESISCGGCGHTMSADEWQDREIEHFTSRGWA